MIFNILVLGSARKDKWSSFLSRRKAGKQKLDRIAKKHMLLCVAQYTG